MIILLLGVASAQVFTDDSAGCLADDAWPVAGSAGLENGLSALRTNAQTYSATRFAEENLFPIWGELKEELAAGEADADRFFVRMAYEYNANLGVSRVPLWFSSDECPDAFRFSTSPVDVYANNVGFVGRKGNLGFYLSSAFTFGSVAFPDNRSRAFGSAMLYPMIGAYGLMFAPLAGDGLSVVQGSTAYALDWLGGAVYEGRFLKARAGYIRSQGLHASVENPQTGLFANAVVRGDGGFDFSQYAAGAERIPLGRAGRTSLFTRGVPISESGQPGERIQLRTQHIQQDDIGGRFDVAASWATAPEPLLNEAWLAVHSPGFSDPDALLGRDFAIVTRLGGGTFQLPAQYYYGLDDAVLYTVRLDMRYSLGGIGVMTTTVGYNDPDTLLVFPFARDIVSIRLRFEGEF